MRYVLLFLISCFSCLASTVTGPIADLAGLGFNPRVEFWPLSTPYNSGNTNVVGPMKSVQAVSGNFSQVLLAGRYLVKFPPTTNSFIIIVPNDNSTYSLSTLSSNVASVSSITSTYFITSNQFASALTNNETRNVTFLGTVASSGFQGDGNGLTELDADNLIYGSIPIGRIPDGLITSNKLDATAYVAFMGGGSGSSIAAGTNIVTVTNGSLVTVHGTANVTQAGLAAGSYSIDGSALAFSELYSAWVSKYGSDSTGTVGKRERPFAGVSNAVYAVKTALGSANTNGVVYIGAGLWDEHLVNLQRTNLPGISLIGQGGIATLLTSRVTSSLTNLGALVLVGHSTRVIGVSISNDMSATFKQAAIGYDVTRSATIGSTIIVPTNVFINVPIGRGSSDVGYFYDSAGPGDFDITMFDCDWLSKWDAVFLSTVGTDGQFKIKKSVIKVVQPDGYSFPGLGSGSGRARAVFIGEGNLSVENSSIIALGGNQTSNEVTGLTFLGSTVGYTNLASFIDAGGSTGTVKKELTSDTTQYLGKITPDQISGTFQSITNSGKYNGVKVYRAWITQTGTAAPSATVLENSLGATPTWARTGVGTYTCNTSALFTSGKTLIRFTQSTSSSGGFHLGSVEWATTSQIILRTVDDAQVGGPTDAILNNGSSIEILVYP